MSGHLFFLQTTAPYLLAYKHAKTTELPQQRSSSVATQQTTVSSIPSHPSTAGVSRQSRAYSNHSFQMCSNDYQYSGWVFLLLFLSQTFYFMQCSFNTHHVTSNTRKPSLPNSKQTKQMITWGSLVPPSTLRYLLLGIILQEYVYVCMCHAYKCVIILDLPC